MTLHSNTTKIFPALIIVLLFTAAPALGKTCDRNALTTYMSVSEEMQTLDSSVHNFLNSLNTQKDIELLILASTAPDYIAEFHQRLVLLAVNQPIVTDDLNEFYLCSGLQQSEIDKRFNDTFERHFQLIEHLQQHDSEFFNTTFATKLDEYHNQAIAVFGDDESGVLRPLKTTENIFTHLTHKYAQQATIYDFWELKQAKGTEHFMDVTGLNIQHFSPQAQLQKHLDRGLSKESFLLFGGPGEGEEYPQSIYHLAHELSGQISSGNLPTIEQIPNRSKLAIIVATSEQNKQDLLKVLSQYETAATQFKKRAAQRYNIVHWKQTPSSATTDKGVLQNWAIDKQQKMLKQGKSIDALLNAQSSQDWSQI